MKKKTLAFGIISCLIVVAAVVCINILLYGGYNEKGVSKYLNITIDNNCEKKLQGEADGYRVYSDNLSEIYFINKNAEQISLKEALESQQITVEDMLSVCKKRKDGNYYGENYMITLKEEQCIISPKSSR